MSTDPLAFLRQAADVAAPTPNLPPRRRTDPIRGRFAWMNDAACIDADPDLFYPIDYGTTLADRQIDPQRTEVPFAICSTCPVLATCRDHAVRNEPMGIWGKTTPHDRLKLRRALGLGRFEGTEELAVPDVGIDDLDDGTRTAAEIGETLGLTRAAMIQHRTRKNRKEHAA